MSCGQTHLASKIRLMKYVSKHPDWHCRPSCFSCKYWQTCYYEMLCEEGEIEERYEYEYRVISSETSYYTVDYFEAAAKMSEQRALGIESTLQRRSIYTDTPWQTLI